MVEQTVGQETPETVNSVENALGSLWEKTREASLLISTLREEKKRLLLKIDELEEELKHSKNESMLLKSQLEKIQSSTALKNAAINLEEDEKRLLQQKLRNVISKLDQYLTP
jgi:chromosome segregation ATPase